MKHIIFSAVISIAIVFSCSFNNVEVISFSPQGKIEQLSNFTIEFSHDLAPAELIGQWIDTKFIEFEPQINGKFMWSSANTLVFSAESQLSPIQKYTAIITDKVLFNTKLNSDFKKFSFNTPDFDVNKVEYFWTNIPHQDYKLSVQANIVFNYPVDPKKLQGMIEVKNDGQVIDNYQIVSEQISDVIAVNFGEVKQKDKKQLFSIKIKKGLYSVYGKKPLEDERTFDSELPPITKLVITDVTSGFSGETPWIEIYTTQKVEENIKSFIVLEPKIDFDIMINDNNIRLELLKFTQQNVSLTIKSGMPGLYGGKLESEFSQDIVLANVTPSLRFNDQHGLYLLRGGSQKLVIDAVNVKEMEVTYLQVFDNNLIHFLNGSYSGNYYGGDYYYDSYYDDSYDDDQYDYTDYYYSSGNSYSIGNYGKQIFTEKVKIDNKNNLLTKVNLDIKEKLNKQFKGIYVITVRSADKRYISDSKIISLSNLGIIAKSVSDEIIVFVNQINTTESVSGATVKIISRNNQKLFEGITDRNGILKCNLKDESIKGFEPSLVIVEKDDDYNFLNFSKTKVNTSRFDVGGLSTPQADYKLFLYGTRNLYRPGDDVNISGILRNEKFEIIKDFPLIIKIINPSGKIFDEFKKDIDEQGAFDLKFNLPVFAQTGQYAAEVYSGSKQFIESYYFSTEEFVPDKIRADVKTDKQKYLPNGIVNLSIVAEYLYGAKGSGLDYQIYYKFSHLPYKSKNYPVYSFSRTSIKNSSMNDINVEGKLDEDGKATDKLQIPDKLSSSGYINTTAFVSVFDPTGRTINRSVDFSIYTRDYFIGIKPGGDYFNVNEKINFDLIAVNSNDQIIQGFSAKAKLFKLEWQTVLKKDGSGKYYYTSEEKYISEWEKEISISEKTQFSFKVSKSGKYELRVYKKDSDEFVARNFYAWGWGSSTSTSFKVDREGRVEITPDKKEYQPGETAKLLFTCPFSGKMLVTLERNNVYSYEYVDVKNKSVELSVKLKDEFMPNVYVTATLFKEHSSDQESPLFVGHGFTSLGVIKNENKIDIKINAPDKIKPNVTQTITIKTNQSKKLKVTLAAVDEGILQIKNYETPDPFEFMFAKRPLGVSSYDLYELLLPEFKKSSSTGGDGTESPLEKRVNPITVKRFKLLSYWSGIKTTGNDGNINIPVYIPQFNGNVRLMVVAYSDQSFGSAEKNMLVADDIIIEPQVPRTLSQNDKLNSVVTLLNTTDNEKNIKINLNVEGPLKIDGESQMNVKIKPKSSAFVSFGINAQSEIGAAKIIFTVTGDAKAKEEIDIAVKPISPLYVESGNGSIKAGETKVINIPKDFLANTQNTMLTISKFPAIKFAKQLKALIGYPYGCAEQTVSRLFPQLYFEDLAKLAAPEYYKTTNPVYYVKEGIKKIESMQLYDGSIAYWQGDNYSNWWATVYAAHFLIEARKAKYNVSETVLNNLLSYIGKKAKEPSTYDYVTYSVENKRTITKIASKEILYSLYVLALAKKEDISTMNYYKARMHLLSEDSKYLLAGSYAAIGKWNSYYEIIPNSFQSVHPERTMGGSFDSDVRANAIMLNVLLDTEPSNKLVPTITKYLVNKIDRAYSTQENAFVFLALGKAARNVSATDMKIDVIVNDKVIKSYTGSDINIKDAALNQAKVTLKASGKGELFYFWSTEGIKLNQKVKEEDSNLRVRREYYSFKTKSHITNSNFTQGELIICKISITGIDKSAENVVITDIVPAGFEIDNPRLGTSTKLDWVSKFPMRINSLDIRDDRLIIFTNAETRWTEYFYLLRAVSQGTFQLPVIGAEAMYDRDYHSYNGAGTIKVNAKN
ncbi:MAG: MG2 domain-containing protein [Ignavibacterium sp.]|jgi:uncharacterized protein YfaS (alpha-2-macroglobulin family)|nr:MG2 domain-containing protein [Ignavibacterium sp.]